MTLFATFHPARLYYTTDMPEPRAPRADEPSDRVLALRAQSGDAESFGELVRRYQTSVFNVCYRMFGERRAAEDLAQEAFVRAFQRLDRFDAARPFGPWMRTVAANLCLNELQRSRRETFELDDERDTLSAPGSLGPEPARVRAERAEAVRAAILRLPPQYRAVIELRHFQDMNYAEIAAALDLPLSAVKSHLFRARKQLASELEHLRAT